MRRLLRGGHQVALSGSQQAIERLRVGDQVLAEDPTSGTMEAEPVRAVIDDGVKPLIGLVLADGSTLRVTSNHYIWVDARAHVNHAGWLQAGQLRPGDRLRTASGHDVAVLAVNWNLGEAHVYTLTVANDHTFFVGSAQVLVHNADSDCALLASALQVLSSGTQTAASSGVTHAVLAGLDSPGGSGGMVVQFASSAPGHFGQWLSPGVIEVSRDPSISAVDRAATLIHEWQHNQTLTGLIADAEKSAGGALSQREMQQLIDSRIQTTSSKIRLDDEAPAFWAEIEWATANHIETAATKNMEELAGSTSPAGFWKFLRGLAGKHAWGNLSPVTFQQVAKKVTGGVEQIP